MNSPPGTTLPSGCRPSAKTDDSIVVSSRGYLLWVGHFDWRGAESEFRRAVELAPESGDAKF